MNLIPLFWQSSHFQWATRYLSDTSPIGACQEPSLGVNYLEIRTRTTKIIFFFVFCEPDLDPSYPGPMAHRVNFKTLTTNHIYLMLPLCFIHVRNHVPLLGVWKVSYEGRHRGTGLYWLLSRMISDLTYRKRMGEGRCFRMRKRYNCSLGSLSKHW